jgi:HEAT repeat protein
MFVSLSGVLALLVAGCSEGKFNFGASLDNAVQKIFQPRRTPQQYMLIAVSDADPDQRRAAVAKIAKSKRSDQEWAIKGFIAIALLESDPQTRCVAIRALARTKDPRAVETLLKLLDYRSQPPREVRPPDALCRWDATAALADLSAEGAVAEESRAAVCDMLVDRLRSDNDRHVRIAAARGLGYYAEQECVKALIVGLRDDHFAVAHECENALVRLTGRTQDCNALAWSDWYEANGEDLFAAAGEVPESRRPKYRNRWGKFAYNTKQFFRWLYPGKKEE